MCRVKVKVEEEYEIVPRQGWKRSIGCAELKLKITLKIKLCHDKGGRGAQDVPR